MTLAFRAGVIFLFSWVINSEISGVLLFILEDCINFADWNTLISIFNPLLIQYFCNKSASDEETYTYTCSMLLGRSRSGADAF